MLRINIPGNVPLMLEHLVLDYNGTLAEDGRPLSGLAERLAELAALLTLHVVTADTHGSASEMLAALPVRLHRLGPENQDRQKANYVRELGGERVAAMGNGRNDALMLAEAALGVAILQREGCSTAALLAADLVCGDIRDGLDLLRCPERLRATLRN